jgi:hypothetical protein
MDRIAPGGLLWREYGTTTSLSACSTTQKAYGPLPRAMQGSYTKELPAGLLVVPGPRLFKGRPTLDRHCNMNRLLPLFRRMHLLASQC